MLPELPDEILEHIFVSYLSKLDILRVIQCNKVLYERWSWKLSTLHREVILENLMNSSLSVEEEKQKISRDAIGKLSEQASERLTPPGLEYNCPFVSQGLIEAWLNLYCSCHYQYNKVAPWDELRGLCVSLGAEEPSKRFTSIWTLACNVFYDVLRRDTGQPRYYSQPRDLCDKDVESIASRTLFYQAGVDKLHKLYQARKQAKKAGQRNEVKRLREIWWRYRDIFMLFYK